MSQEVIKTLDALFAAQKRAFAADNHPGLQVRLDRLRRLEALMVKLRVPLQESVRADFGSHSAISTDLFETGGVLGRNRYIQASLEEWMKPSERPLLPVVHGASTAKVIRQPKGVMGVIGPWNFPVECSLVMVNDILAAGNRVIVKGSESAPATGALLEREIAAAFDKTELAFINGDVSVSQRFATMPWDHLTYTGGGHAARSILAAAAANLTPVTLELGGKNPTLFTETGIDEALVERFLYFRIFKGGQVCTSPDYVLVPESRIQQWVEIAKKCWARMYPAYVGHADATGAINEKHFDRVMGYVDEARAAGCEVVSLNGDKPDRASRQIPMYVAIDPSVSLSVMTEEIFGPVTAIKPYKTFDEALQFIASRPRPLAAYFVGRETALIERFSQEVVSGGIGINVFGFQGADPGLPFGGVGASGMGCHAGFEGFVNYTHSKPVFNCSDDNPLMLSLKAPYGEFAQAFSDAIFPPQ